MQMSIDEFEKKFFDPALVTDYLEKRQGWVEQFKATDAQSRWTTYFMLLGGLAAGGRLSPSEFQSEGPARYSAGDAPTPEKLYAMTVLTQLLK